MAEEEPEIINHRARGFFRRDEIISPSLIDKINKLNGSNRPLDVLIIVGNGTEAEVGFMLDGLNVAYTYFKDRDYVAKLTKEEIKMLAEKPGLRMFDFPYSPKKVSKYYSLNNSRASSSVK